MKRTRTVTVDEEITVGTIVKIGSSKDRVVIEEYREASESRDGNYYANVIKTIMVTDLGKENPPIDTWLIKEGSSMNVENSQVVSINDFEIIRSGRPVRKNITYTWAGAGA